MENKTIRVWDREVNCCDNCCMYDNEYRECKYGEFKLTADIGEVDKDCPFSKPLSKEDIESCGFMPGYILESNSDELIKGYEKYINKIDRLLIHDIKEQEHTWCIYKAHCYNEISGNWEQTDLFQGTINNLPEFKLLLKQLNIN